MYNFIKIDNTILNMDQEVIKWLLGADPSVRFQAKRDLLGLPKREWQQDQKLIAKEGWGKRLLDYQDDDGRWGSGLYGPKFISTHYTLMLLRRLEMLPNNQIAKACQQLIKIPAIGETHTDEIRLDTCITGMGLGILSHFNQQDHLFQDIIDFLQRRKLGDGGWNCRHPRVRTSHSSVHTTLLALEGLALLESNYPEYRDKVIDLQETAHEFLLVHHLYKSHRSGETIHHDMIQISFPPRWKYNILTALDYFRMIDHPYDQRMYDALEIIKSKENKGKWTKGKQMSGKKYFSLNQPRRPSQINTLRALRVLKKYSS